MTDDDELRELRKVAVERLPQIRRVLAQLQGPRDALETNARALRDVADEIALDPRAAMERDPDEFFIIVRRLAGTVAGLGQLLHLEHLADVAQMEAGDS